MSTDPWKRLDDRLERIAANTEVIRELNRRMALQEGRDPDEPPASVEELRETALRLRTQNDAHARAMRTSRGRRTRIQRRRLVVIDGGMS